MIAEGGIVGLEIAVHMIKRPATKGLARIQTWVSGHEVLVLGPSRAGKTSFADYLQYGVLEPERDTDKTVDLDKSASFRVSVGRDSSLELKVRRAVDVAGQLGPIEHVRIASKRKPHAIVVLLDLSAPASSGPEGSGSWLIEFCKHLDEKLRDNRKMRRRLKTVIFVANKYDKRKSDANAKLMSAFREIIRKHLTGAFGTRTQSIPVMPCILVETDHSTKFADAVVVRLAKMLAA